MSLATEAPLDGKAAVDASLRWVNRYAKLGPAFHTTLPPQPLPQPYWVGQSRSVGQALGLPENWTESEDLLQALSGNRPLAGSQPVATVYSGHQFGVWAGQLGDGRALLLGETESGLELQLKGAGRTPYSRMGDGRAVLRSSIREFLCSEAMHGLGIPTTRALCVTGSDAAVRRETIETAAVVTRVAPSFIRFGHFEHFAANEQPEELRRLADFVIDHYYPACRGTPKFAGNAYAALLETVSERTAALLASWQAVGFCHGVMNTDNMSILGLTLDYGPFQFLDGYDPAHICNHSDTQGRYAFARQPNIAYWNLFCLGQALLPLIGEQELALAALESYRERYPAELETRLRAKLGLAQQADGDRELVEDTLRLLAAEKTDHTIFWRRLSHFAADGQAASVRDLFLDRTACDAWLHRYEARLAQQDRQQASASMLRCNPKFVLRNHLGELAIRQARDKDFSGVEKLLALLAHPYDEHPGHEAEAGFPPEWASSIEISCSS
ncbi:YdiU family protein [Rhodoferax sp. BAB1]|uniref:protein adenylyltransferase SelO n=1 Tax=Rhodoferax sp. BAB1 TaxID=2741720 RepID=UPI0015764428|nr:YdiU family protein [Rhodoferax sp. BAB1]QKO21722.1 YdiU family protein [Rhodoferax sp. BAB1]